MRRPGRNLACSLIVCCFSTQAAVLVTLKNGSQVEAASESREGIPRYLTIGGGTVSLPATDIASIDLFPIHRAGARPGCPAPGTRCR